MIICFLPLFGLLSGCATKNHPFTAERELPACTDISVNSADRFSAESHYEQMVVCIKNKHFAAATFHYARAGVLTWDDYLQTPGAASKARHQTPLRTALSRLTEEEKQQFWSALYATLRDPQSRRRLCSRITPVPVDTAAVIRWNQAKVGYLHCDDIPVN